MFDLYKDKTVLDIDSSLECEEVQNYDILRLVPCSPPHTGNIREQPLEIEVVQLQSMFEQIEPEIIIDFLKTYSQEDTVALLTMKEKVDKKRMQLYLQQHLFEAETKYKLNVEIMQLLHECLQSNKTKISNFAFNILNLIGNNEQNIKGNFDDGSAIVQAIIKAQNGNVNNLHLKYLFGQCFPFLNETTLHAWLLKFTSDVSNMLPLEALINEASILCENNDNQQLCNDMIRVSLILLYPIYADTDVDKRVFNFCKKLNFTLYTIKDDISDLQAIIMSIDLLKKLGDCSFKLLNRAINVSEEVLSILVAAQVLWMEHDQSMFSLQTVKSIQKKINFNRVADAFTFAIFGLGRHFDVILPMLMKYNFQEIMRYHSIIISYLQLQEANINQIEIITSHYFTLYQKSITEFTVSQLHVYTDAIVELLKCLHKQNIITKLQLLIDTNISYYYYLLFPIINNLQYELCFDKRAEILNLLSSTIHLCQDTSIVQSQIAYHQNIREMSHNSIITPFEPICQPYVGLKNLGATCYINSLLQQLYNCNLFCNAILSVKSIEGSMLANLQNTFKALSLKQCIKYYNPEKFIYSLQLDNRPFDVRIQEDAYIFLCRFFDLLEMELKCTQNVKEITSLYEGKLENKILSLDNDFPFETQNTESFCAISLQINDHLSDALDQFFKEEKLSDENAYYCDKYKKKISAKKIMQIKDLPNNLIIHLKRFKYNNFFHTNKKLNERMEFPFVQNFKKWCSNQSMDDSYYTYSLNGIVLHYGNFEGGHYTSFIQNKGEPYNKEWYNYDDTNVNKCDLNSIILRSYGIENDLMEGVGSGAYLLFYERSTPSSISFCKGQADFSTDKILGNYYNKINLGLLINECIWLGSSLHKNECNQISKISSEVLKVLLNFTSVKDDVLKLIKQTMYEFKFTAFGVKYLIEDIFSDIDTLENLVFNEAKSVRICSLHVITECLISTYKSELGVDCELLFMKLLQGLVNCTSLLYLHVKEKEEFVTLMLNIQFVLKRTGSNILVKMGYINKLYYSLSKRPNDSNIETLFKREIKMGVSALSGHVTENIRNNQIVLNILEPIPPMEIEEFTKQRYYYKIIYDHYPIPLITGIINSLLKVISYGKSNSSANIIHWLCEELFASNVERRYLAVLNTLYELLMLYDNLAGERLYNVFIHHEYFEELSLNTLFSTKRLFDIEASLLNMVCKIYKFYKNEIDAMVASNKYVIY